MNLPAIHVDEARAFLIQALAKAPSLRDQGVAYNNQRPAGADIAIYRVVGDYYSQVHGADFRNLDSQESIFIPFYDAAWELCRIGVLRPGAVAPKGGGGGGAFRGDDYALTAFGIQWVKAAAGGLAIPTDPGRFIEVIKPFEKVYGAAFLQRASEAVRCHRTNNYLACCVMAGAAVESILLALAIAKTGDEDKVIAEYRAASGRKKIMDRLLANVSQTVADPFRSAAGILSFWRDEAGHGRETTISEIEAHSALTQLLRLAQFASDNRAAIIAKTV